jgi:hypothetical protein
MRAHALAPAVLAVLCAGPLAGQGADELARTRALVEEHRYEEARRLLGAWWESSSGGARPAARAEGLYLRGLLATDPADAERDYLRLAVEHPQAPQAQEALLRLGQGRTARGDWDAAALYLRRLVTDYPEGRHRTAGLLWLGRAEEGAGRPEVACATYRRASATSAAAGGPGEELRAAVERCAATPPLQARHASELPSRPRVLEARGFRDTAHAERVRDELRFVGHPAFLVRLGGTTETRLRVEGVPPNAMERLVAALAAQGVTATELRGP